MRCKQRSYRVKTTPPNATLQFDEVLRESSGIGNVHIGGLTDSFDFFFHELSDDTGRVAKNQRDVGKFLVFGAGGH